MLCLNYALTLMVLCFVPFIVIFTVIFRKFSRRAYRKVKDATTDINTYLSENLSGIKVTQILAARTKRWRSSTKKPDPFQGHAGTDFCVRRIPPAGLHAVHQLYFVPVLPGRHGPPEQRFFPGADHHRRHHRHLLHVHFQVLYPIQNLAEQFNWLQSALASSEKSFLLWIFSPSWWMPPTPLS